MYGGKINYSNNYNQYCPWTDNDGDGDTILYRALTGCVPTAMAQLLYHYKKNLPTTEYDKLFLSKDGLIFHLQDKYGSPASSNLMYLVNNDHFEFVDPNHVFSYKFDLFGWDYSQSNSKKLAAKMMRDCGLLILAKYGNDDTNASE